MKIDYEEHGNPNGKPVILLPAFPLSRQMWKPQLAALSQIGCRIITPDFRGFGENHNFADINTMEDLAKDIADLMNDLKIDKAIVGGLSMGGYVLFNLYRLFPEKFSAIILADSNCSADNQEKRKSRFDLIEKIETAGTQALIDNMLGNLISDYTKTNNSELTKTLEAEFLAANPKGVIAALRGLAARKDHCHLLKSIDVPSLLIFGEHDKVTNLETAEKMQGEIKNSELMKIKNAGHYSNLEQPEQFNDSIIGFIKKIGI